MKQKKLMLLGGLRYLLPVIEAAHKLGIYVITCDYIPGNIAHKYSDEYHNVSILDKEAVLNLARELKIDGILSFAVDPGVITAAYVQEQMGLPAFGPYESVCILQNKDKFRNFLAENGFNTPWSYSFDSISAAMEATANFTWPAIVKPTDAAGSKGVSRVNSPAELQPALEYAMKKSFGGKIIIEEFIEKAGCSSDSDCFSIEGELKFASFSAQRFDEHAPNPYTPSAYSWPSTMTQEQEQELFSELQRVLTLLKMRTCVYNVETRVGTNGKPYIMEISPRGGGNRLSEIVRYATGTDLITNSVRAAVGLPTEDVVQRPYQGYWMIMMLHSRESGIFDRLDIAEEYRDKVVETCLWVSPGDEINGFNGANDAIGTVVLNLDSNEAIERVMADVEQVCKVKIRV